MPSSYNGNYSNQDSFATGTAVTGTASANAGAATQITSVAHGLQTNDVADLTQIGGTFIANAEWKVTRVDANNFTIPLAWALAGGAWTSGGHVQPLVWPVAYAPVSDNDDPTGANFAAASTYPSADRDTLLLISTGAYKLASRYDEHFFNAGSQGSNATASEYWTFAYGTLNTWQLLSALAASTGGANISWLSPGATVQVQLNDLIEIEWCGSVLYNPASAAGLAMVSLAYTNQPPVTSPSFVRAPGGGVIGTASAADIPIRTMTLKSIVSPVLPGPFAVQLMGWNNTASATLQLVGDYTFGIKVWRPTIGVPQ